MTLTQDIFDTLGAHAWKRGIRDHRTQCMCGADLATDWDHRQHRAEAVTAVVREHFTSDQGVERAARAMWVEDSARDGGGVAWGDLDDDEGNDLRCVVYVGLVAAMEAGQ